MVVLDATFLVLLLDPEVTAGAGAKDRVNYLVESLEKQNQKIIVPTPVLSEVLIGAGDAAPDYLDELGKSSRFSIKPFGVRAAVEAAAAHREAIGQGDKKEGSGSTWTKVKFDRQIVAIAKVENADIIYSDDGDIERYAKRDGIKVIKSKDLPARAVDPQIGLPLSEPNVEDDPIE